MAVSGLQPAHHGKHMSLQAAVEPSPMADVPLSQTVQEINSAFCEKFPFEGGFKVVLFLHPDRIPPP